MSFSGKYDNEINKIIFNLTPSKSTNLNDSIDNVKNSFGIVSEYYQNYVSIDVQLKTLRKINEFSTDVQRNEYVDFYSEKLGAYEYEQILSYTHTIAKECLFIGCKLFEMKFEKLKEISESLYKRKNAVYKDGWYYMGCFGVYSDLHRKVTRLFTVINDNSLQQHDETLLDTVIDTFNYSVLLIVAMENKLK